MENKSIILPVFVYCLCMAWRVAVPHVPSDSETDLSITKYDNVTCRI